MYKVSIYLLTLSIPNIMWHKADFKWYVKILNSDYIISLTSCQTKVKILYSKFWLKNLIDPS